MSNSTESLSNDTDLLRKKKKHSSIKPVRENIVRGNVVRETKQNGCKNEPYSNCNL